METPSKVWLSPEFLGWDGYHQSHGGNNEKIVREHHSIWQHANELLVNRNDRHFVTSCLIQLNRVVDFRDKALDECYSFRKIPGLSRQSRHEIMELVGVVKPLMRKKLDSVRNRLMHIQGTEPPPVQECAELAEFVWYFLKSTDRIAAFPIETVQFYDNGADTDAFNPDVEVEIADSAWKLIVTAKVRPAHISSILIPEWVQIDTGTGLPWEAAETTTDGKAFRLRGIVVDSDQFVQSFVKKMFQVY